MINLAAYALTQPPAHKREDVVLDLWRRHRTPLLVLNTCQRLECFGCVSAELEDIGIEQKCEDVVAFERLVRIAAGLESRILGELEVLGQVRRAYKFFSERHGKEGVKLDRIFQEAISLARKARRESGIDGNLTSLSGLASREVMARVGRGEPVAVVGAGSMAGSVARYLHKRGKQALRVSSRCPERAASIAMEVGGYASGLDDISHLLDGVAAIVTATSAPHPVLYAHHLERAQRPLVVVDLGVPPDCCEDVRRTPGVAYVGLDAIESKAQINTNERRKRAKAAARIIRDGSQTWYLAQRRAF